MGYVLGLAQDIPSERWGEMAIANANHPAFIYAHLAIYPNRVFAMLANACTYTPTHMKKHCGTVVSGSLDTMKMTPKEFIF